MQSALFAVASGLLLHRVCITNVGENAWCLAWTIKSVRPFGLEVIYYVLRFLDKIY